MPQKSYGKMRRSRKKLMAKERRGLPAYLKKFSLGDRVHVELVPSSPLQHPRFHGKTGTVVEKRGRNYVVQIRDGSVSKKVFFRPEHLRVQEQKEGR